MHCGATDTVRACKKSETPAGKTINEQKSDFFKNSSFSVNFSDGNFAAIQLFSGLFKGTVHVILTGNGGGIELWGYYSGI